MFAAAYGFPPSACKNENEAMGLFSNIKLAMAIQSAMFARGVAACLSPDANADLMQDCGASTKDIIRMKMQGMKEKSQGAHGANRGASW